MEANERPNETSERAIGQETATVRPPSRPSVHPSFPFSAGKLLTPWTAPDAAAAAPRTPGGAASPNLMFFHLYYLHSLDRLFSFEFQVFRDISAEHRARSESRPACIGHAK